MGRDWKKWFESEGKKKLFRKDNLLILVLGGILLFVIALPTGSSGTNDARSGTNNARSGERRPEAGAETLPDGGGTGTETAELRDYAAELEARLTEALADMDEVGQVRVMITLKSSSELVVEREMPVSQSLTTETDAQGGNRTVNTGETGDTVVYSTEDGSSVPYVVKTYVPEIEGVLVVAEGAGSGRVNRTVTEVVQALFGVEAHKVKVVRMERKTK